MCGVILVDAGRSRSTNLDVMPMYWSLPGYHHEYLKFYQLPNSNFFTHRLLFFSREATSETYGPHDFLLIYLPCDVLFLCIFIQIYLTKKYKNTLLRFIFIYFIWRSIYQSTTIYLTSACQFLAPLPERDWQPLQNVELRGVVICVQVMFTLCCLVLLLVRYLGFITEANTLLSLCYIIPPSPGKYRRSPSRHELFWRYSQRAIKRNFWRPFRGGSST